MVGRTDDETLSRWFDGELPPKEHEEVARAIDSDTDLAVRADSIRAQDASVRKWFDDQLAPPPPVLEQSVKAAFAARRRDRKATSGRAWWLPAAAAAAVLIAGIAGFDYLIDRRVNDALDRMRAERASDMAMLASAMQDVLETRESGVPVSFENDQTGLAVTFIPTRTWKSASGHWCREFTEVFPEVSSDEAPVGTACRNSDGHWMRVRTELPGPGVPFMPDPAGRMSL